MSNLISRERAERIISEQDVKELARTAYRAAAPQADGSGGVGWTGAATLDLISGEVRRETVFDAFDANEPAGEVKERTTVAIVALDWESVSDEFGSSEAYAKECASRGLEWEAIQSELDDIYGWH